MSKYLDVRISICPDCGSDDLQLYAMEEHLKPTHSICQNCERDEMIESLQKEREDLKTKLGNAECFIDRIGELRQYLVFKKRCEEKKK